MGIRPPLASSRRYMEPSTGGSHAWNIILTRSTTNSSLQLPTELPSYVSSRGGPGRTETSSEPTPAYPVNSFATQRALFCKRASIQQSVVLGQRLDGKELSAAGKNERARKKRRGEG